MHAAASPHLQRRRGMAIGLYLAAPALSIGFALLGVYRRLFGLKPKPGITVFQSYMVGDLFMALPALKALRESLAEKATWASSSHLDQVLPLQIICRPDCVPLLQAEGFQALGLAHAGFTRNTPGAYWQSLRAAWSLRAQATTLALDTDADPRTAVLLRVMGCQKIYSYSRPYALFYTSRFLLPENPVHQAEKNVAVMRGFCQAIDNAALPGMRPGFAGLGEAFDQVLSRQSALLQKRSSQQPTHKNELRIWVMAVTRKDTKNWPLPYWHALLEKLQARGMALTLVDVPDGDTEWRKFVDAWKSRASCVTLPLPDLWVSMQEATHILSLDNFFGHMAAYAGKPVLWLNGSSDATQVRPLGAGKTEVVQLEPMPCRPCGHRCTEARHAHCLTDLKVEVVWPKVMGFLGIE